MSNPRLSLIALALPALFLGLPALAQGPQADRPMRDGRGPQPVVLAEANQRALDRAAELDANGDGFIDAAELEAMHEKARAERAQRRLSKFDTDGDGRVTVDEFVSVRRARLAAMDADGDGVVSVEEFRAGAQDRGRGHRHEKHRRGAPDAR